MSQICLENIVSVRDYCNNKTAHNTSGYDLMDAPEINLSNLNDLANAEYTSGLALLKNCIRLALRDIETDFISVLHANNIVAQNFHSEEINTGIFTKEYENDGANAKGIVIHKNDYRGIKKIKIKKIRIFPVEDVPSAELKFIDSGKEAVMNVQLKGGQINEFAVDYFVESQECKIVLNGVKTYSSQLTCLLGCGGGKPNQCGYVKGWNGYSETKTEGFGINAVFSCECDYSQVLCQQSKNFVGLLIWLKARIYALEERINSTRLTPFIIYGQEEAKQQRLELINEYNSKWNVFIDTLPNLLKNDECFTCTGAKIVTNV